MTKEDETPKSLRKCSYGNFLRKVAEMAEWKTKLPRLPKGVTLGSRRPKWSVGRRNFLKGGQDDQKEGETSKTSERGCSGRNYLREGAVQRTEGDVTPRNP